MGGNMADFETGDVVRLGAAFLYKDSDAVVNTFHVQIVSGGPMAFAQAALDFQEWIDDLYTPLLGRYSDDFDSDRISVKNETQNTVWGSIAFSTPLVGTNLTDELPAQVALLGFGRTSISRVQIRKYWGPFTESACTGGLWLSTIRADVQTAMDYIIGQTVLTQGLTLQGVAYNKALGRATVALTATTSQTPVVQRRRRIGRGS